jgi:aminopeptidase N
LTCETLVRCWQPAAKAIFEVALTVDAHLTALSNMPEASVVSLKNNKRKFTFLPSVKMSTYLLAFVVGELDFLAGVTKNGVPIRCFSPPGVSHRCQFALDCALRCLDLYDDYFEIHYPLPKLDMIAIPEFAAGAMENWGLGGCALRFAYRPPHPAPRPRPTPLCAAHQPLRCSLFPAPTEPRFCRLLQ